jgi:hypothetical protein
MMEVDDIQLDQLVWLIYNGLRDRRWLYLPPGPLAGQVFDKEACKQDIRRFLEAQPTPLVKTS